PRRDLARDRGRRVRPRATSARDHLESLGASRALGARRAQPVCRRRPGHGRTARVLHRDGERPRSPAHLTNRSPRVPKGAQIIMAGNPDNASLWVEADVFVNPDLDGAIPASIDEEFDPTWGLVGLLNGDDGFVTSRSEDKS